MTKAICSIAGCERSVQGRGWCSTHYSRWHDHGDPLADISRRRLGPCTVEGCEKPAKARNLCVAHYTRFLRYGSSDIVYRPHGRRPRKTACEADEACSGKPVAKGLCPKHYWRWRKYGTTVPPKRTWQERFWAKVNEDGPVSEDRPDLGQCWIWTAALNKGYGVFKPTGQTTQGSHRVAYQLLADSIPDDLELDHLCRNRACVNPDHLEPVTHKENCLRGVGIFAVHAAQDACVHGHEFTPENTILRNRPEGGRRCRTCYLTSQREIRQHRARRQRKTGEALALW